MSKRVLVDTSDDDERIQYVLGNRTKKFLPTFLAAFAGPFWQNCDDERDEESSEAEIFLLTRAPAFRCAPRREARARHARSGAMNVCAHRARRLRLEALKAVPSPRLRL